MSEDKENFRKPIIKIETTKDGVLQLLNRWFPEGKIKDNNPRRHVVRKDRKFTNSDVSNYIKRGQIPATYIRAKLICNSKGLRVTTNTKVMIELFENPPN